MIIATYVNEDINFSTCYVIMIPSQLRELLAEGLGDEELLEVHMILYWRAILSEWLYW